jgi:hypothetical protein
MASLAAAAERRLLAAMEQRERRCEMEALLRAESPTALLDFDAPLLRGPAAGRKALSRLRRGAGLANPLSYIVAAVDEAEREFFRDPAAFPFFTLQLQPPHDVLQDSGDAVVGADAAAAADEPQPATPAAPLGGLEATLRGREQVRRRGDDVAVAIAANGRPRASRTLVLDNASAITPDLLPVVCDYVTARLGRCGLQSVAMPTLAFRAEFSAAVAETLLSAWIVGHGPRLLNLFLGDGVNFSTADFARLVGALRANRLAAIVGDRSASVFAARVQRAATHLDWFAGGASDRDRAVASRQRRAPATARDGAVPEVQLGGTFARIIASESKRRYRIMQIELDELVPMLVGVALGARLHGTTTDDDESESQATM